MLDTTKSLTYAELAVALDPPAGSVRNLVRRKRWPRHAGNDGTTRVVIPVDVLDEVASRPHPLNGESRGDTVPPREFPAGLDPCGDRAQRAGAARLVAVPAQPGR